MRNSGLNETQVQDFFLNEDYQKKYQQPHIDRQYNSHGRKQRTSESFFMKVKEDSEKAGLFQ